MSDTASKPPASDVAFTASVKAAQTRLGSRAHMERTAATRPWATTIPGEMQTFLAAIDTFFFATASAACQPYIQHRGGPAGFLKALDDRTLGFADFGGNRQYITVGNLAENDRAHIFILHFATRQRIKLWGRARIVEGDASLLERLAMPGYTAKVERAILFDLEAWDVNCQQHIVARYTEEEIAPSVDRLVARIAELEEQVRFLGDNPTV